jgi:hypothetical protein
VRFKTRIALRFEMLLGVLAVAAGVCFAWPGVAGAQAPAQDSVVLMGGPAQAGLFTLIAINATSGPSGENPSGQVRFDIPALPVMVGGPVTCLAVRGNTATINVQSQIGFLGIVTMQVVDGQPDTFDSNAVGRAPTDCSPFPPTFALAPLSSGNIIVVDAPPLPTSKDQCKNGGWRNFSDTFQNQGQCVAFAQRGPKP